MNLKEMLFLSSWLVLQIRPTLLLLPLFPPVISSKNSLLRLERDIIKRLCLILCGLLIFVIHGRAMLTEKERDLRSQRGGLWRPSESHLLGYFNQGQELMRDGNSFPSSVSFCTVFIMLSF